MKNSLPGIHVEVHGFVMLRKVKPGKYRMVLAEHYSMPLFWFFKPKGKKAIIGHFSDDVAAWFRPANHPDLNKIVILPS